MKLARALAALLAIFGLAACSENVPDEITGVFVDSTVANLGYECGSDTTRKFTNGDGEFTCGVGQELRFYVGEILLGSVIVTPGLEVVTPVMLTGADIDEMTALYYGDMGEPSDELLSSIAMGMVLQAMDDDGDPSNGIVIHNSFHEAFPEARQWDGDGDMTPVADTVFAALEDAEVEIPDIEEAFEHLLAENEKLLHGQYSGTINEEGETIRIDLFLFDNPGGSQCCEPGLQARMLISNEESPEPFPIEIGAPFVELGGEEDDSGVLLIFDYSLQGIVVRVYDMEGINEAQIEPTFDENGMLDESVIAAHLLHTVNLVKVVAAPDVTMRDVGEFLASTPNGDDVPEDLEEQRSPRVYISLSTPMPEIPELPEIPEMSLEALYGGMGLWGHAKKVGLEGEFENMYLPGGHLILASLDPQSMVYRGRVFMVVFPDEELPMILEGGSIEGPPIEGPPIDEQGPTVGWGNATVTINADGTASVAIEGDDGTSVNESLEVDYAGVGVPF